MGDEENYYSLIIVDDEEKISIIQNEDLVIVGVGAILLVAYVLLMKLDIPVLSVAEKVEQGHPIVYLMRWGEYEIFADAYGCLLPLLLGILFLVVIVAKREDQTTILVLILTGLISFGISTSWSLFSSPDSMWQAPRLSVFPFVLSPLLSWFVVLTLTKSRRIKLAEKLMPIGSLSHGRILLLSLSVYSINAVASLLFDLAISQSPYGVIHLGAAGLLDGLVWAPVLSAVVFSTFLVLRGMLHLNV